MSRLTEKELVLIRQERAATPRHAVAAPGRRTGLLASLATAVAQSLRRRRTLAELSRLDDRLLRDIGLERGNLEGFAEALSAQGHARGGLLTRLRRWHLKRTTVNELRALDDRALDDIGIARGDIPARVEAAIAAAEAERTVPARLAGLVTDLQKVAARRALQPGGAGYAWHAKLAAERSLAIAAERQAS